MKQFFLFLCAISVSIVLGGSLSPVAAQSPTPDPFVSQLTNVPNTAFGTSIGDMTANGRFVVFVSNADLSTQRFDEAKNNADGVVHMQTTDVLVRQHQLDVPTSTEVIVPGGLGSILELYAR